MKLNHTPGPWSVSPRHASCVHGNRPIKLPKGVAHPQVATVLSHETMEDGEQEANARLIAAAPDLLAACEAVAEFDDCEDAADWKDAYARLVRGCVAAVRAAKGGAA